MVQKKENSRYCTRLIGDRYAYSHIDTVVGIYCGGTYRPFGDISYSVLNIAKIKRSVTGIRYKPFYFYVKTTPIRKIIQKGCTLCRYLLARVSQKTMLIADTS